MFQKQERIEDEAYRKYCRELPCFVTNREGVDFAHIRLGSHTGISQKPNDYDAHPLNPSEHRLQHQIGEATYWRDILSTKTHVLMECVRAAGRIRYLAWLVREGRKDEAIELLRRF
jgi:hypothetical protein